MTRDEELRVTRVYKDLLSEAPSGKDKKKKKPAKAAEEDGDDDNAAVTAAFEDTGAEEKGEDAAEEPPEATTDPDAAADTEGGGSEEKEAGDEPATEQPKAAPAPTPGAGEGLSLDDVRTALTQLDLTLDDEQFERYVVKFFAAHGLDPLRDDGAARLELDGFLALVSVVRTPGHAFGGRLRKAAARADDEKVVVLGAASLLLRLHFLCLLLSFFFLCPSV